MITAADALPTATDAEQAVIGSLCIEPALIGSVAKRLRPSDFYDPVHREAFAALVGLDRSGVPVDVLTVKRALEGNAGFSDLEPNAAAYLAECGKASPTTAHIEYHANLIRTASRKRRLFETASLAADHARNGSPVDDVLADLLADLEDMRREAVGSQRFRTHTASELDCGDFAVSFLVAMLLVEGQPCILAGGKKSLKTTLLIALGLALATGNDFLGKFHTHGARRFLLCSGESGLGTIQETARRIAAWMGWELSNVPGFIVTDDLPQLDNDGDLSEFRALLERTEAEVVAIDPAYLCLGGDDHGNLFKQGVLLLRLSRLCAELGVTLILCHHTRKNRGPNVDAFEPPELEDIAWAGFQEFARQWLLVGRRERFTPGGDEDIHRLWLNVGGSVGHNGLWAIDINEGSVMDPGGRTFGVTVSKASDAKQDARRRKDEAKAKREAEQIEADHRAIVDAVCRLPGREGTKTKIRDASGFNSKRFDPAFAAALQAGDLIETVVTASNKQTYHGYKLSVEDDKTSHQDSPGLHPDS